MNDDTSPIVEIDRWISRLAEREFDWDALGFQAKINPKYRRAQIRYLGGGGTGKHGDPNVVPAKHFTLSTMLVPPGGEGPLHLHSDVEEVFFVLQGSVTCIWADGERELERTLGPRDMICTPAGVYRGVRNDGDEDALMLVMLGTARPELPTYPEGSPLTEARNQNRER